MFFVKTLNFKDIEFDEIFEKNKYIKTRKVLF